MTPISIQEVLWFAFSETLVSEVAGRNKKAYASDAEVIEIAKRIERVVARIRCIGGLSFVAFAGAIAFGEWTQVLLFMGTGVGVLDLIYEGKKVLEDARRIVTAYNGAIV